MGHAFNEFIVASIRQAIPVISAVMGAFYGSGRASRTGKRQLLNVAAFAGLGWLGGYVVRSTFTHLIEGGSKALPAATVQQFPPPPVRSEEPPPMGASSPMRGIPAEVDPYGFSTAATSPSSGSPAAASLAPKTSNDGVSYGPVPITASKQSAPGRKNKTLVATSYGNVYGN